MITTSLQGTGPKIDSNVATYSEQDGSPTIVGPPKTADEIVADSVKLPRHFHGVHLNGRVGSDVVVIT